MNQEFNHAANDSPGSVSSKQAAPLMWCAIVATLIALAVLFAVKG